MANNTDNSDLFSAGIKKPGFFSDYAIVIATFFVMIATGIVMSSFGVFFKPVSTQFGWTRAETSGAFSLSIIISGLMGIVTGRLGDRISPRLVIIICGVFEGLAYLLLSRMNALWQLYVFYGILLGAGITVVVPVTSLIARWYGKRRGFMTGITMSGAAIGAAIAPPIATQFISSYSWSISYIIVGCIALVITAVTGKVLHDPDPVRWTWHKDKAAVESPNSEVKGYSFQEAVRTGPFWILGIIFFCYSFAQQTIAVHIVPHTTDLGISAVSAAAILSVVNGASIIGSFGLGSANDRIGSGLSLVLSLVVMSAALLFLLEASELWSFYLFAIIFGVGCGGTVILRSTMVAESFGLRSHGAITGVIFFISSIGGTIGPLVAGHIFDISGQYKSAFLVIAMLSIVGLVMALLLRLRTARLR